MIILPEDIDTKEVLRYLSMPEGANVESINKLVDWAVDIVVKTIRPRNVYETFGYSMEENGVLLESAGVCLKGEAIKKHLAGGKTLVLMAATLGIEMELLINRYKGELTKALVIDAVATTVIEKYCDSIEEGIRKAMAEKGSSINFRFSPGYGDLPIELQPDIIRILNAEKRIGLTCSKEFVMIPRKSVTAIIGVFEKPQQEREKSCDNCEMKKSCKLRKRD